MGFGASVTVYKCASAHGALDIAHIEATLTKHRTLLVSYLKQQTVHSLCTGQFLCCQKSHGTEAILQGFHILQAN